MSAFKVHELLNPSPSSPPRPFEPPKEPSSPSHLPHSPTQSAPASSWSRGPTYATSAAAVTSTYEAANVLTALATSGPPSYNHAYASPTASYNVSREPYSPVGGHAQRTSTFGSVAGPQTIEPSPSTDRPQAPHSPTTLDQYHHGSKSPEDQVRRQSIFSASSEAPRLAPIQSLTSALGDQINGKPPRENAYGHDTSSYAHNTPLQPSTSGNNTALNDIVASREPGFLRDTPVTKQIREPSPLKTDVKMSTEVKQQSPSTHIKSEESPAPIAQMTTPTRTTPNGTQGTPPQDDMDPETRKLVEKLKNEHGVRGARAKSSIEGIPAFEPPQPLPKKRVAPKPSVVVTKKGTAKKPPPKKRKVEAVDAASPASAATRGSPTPSRKKGSKANTPALGSSPSAEDQFVDDVEDEGASVASGDDVYCVCRKGDDHSWMIACDGGCEDWFHGKCVHIREEDGDLIDRYICPNCAKKSGTSTTWKPMCRRDGCRKPARVTKSNTSKYCSDYCGELFMSRKVEQSNMQAGGVDAQKRKNAKSRRKSVYTDNISNAGEESDDEDLGPRGGSLRSGEIKALATSSKDVESFRSLGDGVLSPPPTVSPSAEKFPNGALDGADMDKLPLSYTLEPSETERINSIASERDVLRKRHQLLKDKEKFVAMTREQVSRYADREGIKIKDICGYDRRLGWDESQFERWLNSSAGKAAFRLGTLDPAENGDEEAQEGETKVNGDLEMADADDEKSNDKEFLCSKKRCQKHQGWQKLALHDVRNAESQLADEMRNLEKEEREIRERAMLRWRKETGAKDLEGTVEIVG